VVLRPGDQGDDQQPQPQPGLPSQYRLAGAKPGGAWARGLEPKRGIGTTGSAILLISFPLLASYRRPVLADLQPMPDNPGLQQLFDKTALCRGVNETLSVCRRGATAEFNIHRESDRLAFARGIAALLRLPVQGGIDRNRVKGYRDAAKRPAAAS
jgi:hypothetical protein